MTETINHKRGDTYKLDVALTEIDNITPINITDWTVRSQIRQADTLIASLEFVSINPTNGEYSLVGRETINWPLGKLSSDIEYTDAGGMVCSTDSYKINVIDGVTHD